METLNDLKTIRELAETMPNIKDKIEKTINECNDYLDVLKYEEFEEKEEEKEVEAIKRAESVFDRLDEIIQKRDLVLKNGIETIEIIDNVKNGIEKVVKSCENDGMKLAKANNRIINKIISLEQRKINRKIEVFNNKKKEWENHKIDIKRIIQKTTMERIKRIEEEEMKQIEEWTKMKIDKVIFDSDIDNWDVNNSVFDQKLLNKSNLIFIIEDEDDNKFGGYINAKIDRIDEYISDGKSFVFSLKSNGRLNEKPKNFLNFLFNNEFRTNQITTTTFGMGSLSQANSFATFPMSGGLNGTNNNGTLSNNPLPSAVGSLSDMFKNTFETKTISQKIVLSDESDEIEEIEEIKDKMKKFKIIEPENAFCLGSKGNSTLFLFGYNQDAQSRGGPKRDIYVGKMSHKNSSSCVQQTTYYGNNKKSFNYRKYQNALCGKVRFTPKRITVIQLI